MKVVMHVKNVCTAETWCYMDADLCTVTKQNSVNFIFTFTSNDDVTVYVTNWRWRTLIPTVDGV
jgi:hypothetical protein